MALNQIIKSAEIIEAEKSKAIDQNHKEIWSELYEEFTAEEANSFYFALKKIRVKPGKTIIQQGKLNNRLFFIDQGTLKFVWFKDDREQFLKNITRGEMAGQDTFFSITVATSSTISVEDCTLHYLEREKYAALVKKIPGFDNKLDRFYRKTATEKIEDILKKKEIERRKFHRYKVTGKIAVNLLDSNNKPADATLYGMLEGLSEGGLSFGIKSPNKETARMYLGRIVLLKVMSKKTGVAFTKKGVVLCVYDLLFNSYSIGLKFAKPIPLSEIQKFMGVD